MYLMHFKTFSIFIPGLLTTKVRLVSSFLNNGFLPGTNIKIWIRSLAEKNSACISSAKFLYRPSDKNWCISWILTPLWVIFFFCYDKKTKFFVLFVSVLALGPGAITNPDCHSSHNLYIILDWENENVIPIPTFLFV